jgi:F0F1-type ATP synthase membrane subunit b/b'
VIEVYRQTEDRLRAVVREAHEATKDLRAALREARNYADEIGKNWAGQLDQIIELVETRAHEAADAEMAEHGQQLQAEMNRQAAILNEVIDRARIAVVEAIIPAAAELREDGLVITWTGNKFDDDPLRDRSGEPPPRHDRTQIPGVVGWAEPPRPTREEILSHPMTKRLLAAGFPEDEILSAAWQGWADETGTR